MTNFTSLLHAFNDPSTNGVSVDSRHTKSGDIFFALKGDRSDGHHFLQEAAAQGAKYAVIADSYTGSTYNLNTILVPDPLEALQSLARDRHQQFKGKTVAITGSFGKTTTKDFLTTLLKTRFHITATPGNYNTQIGLPLTILNHVKGDEEIIVLEMGMTESGQIKKLVSIAPPDIAILTGVALAHAGNFNSIHEIARAKAEIFSHPKTKTVVIHFPWSALCSSADCITFDRNSSEADYSVEVGEDWATIIEKSVRVQIAKPSLVGQHNFHNLLAAIAVSRHLGISWEEISHASSLLQLPKQRFEFTEKDGALFVNDAYNANETAIKAAIESLPRGRRRLAVIGEMLELGKFSEECHRNVGEHALDHLDEMICFGDECQPIVNVWEKAKREVTLVKSHEEIVKLLKKKVEKGDVILLKGSRANQLEKVLDAL